MQTSKVRLGSTLWCLYVTALLAGLVVGAVWTGDSRAQEEKGKKKGERSDVSLKMTCAEHGAANMTLEFVREDGPGRKVEITGNNNNNLWTVKIDDKVVTPDPQTDKKPGQVKLHVGDKVTWKVTGSTHGIVFPTQKDAEAMFEFDTKQSKALGKSTFVMGFTWGTAKFSAADPLAVATVKKAKDAPAQKAKGEKGGLKMTCAEHGAANMTLEFVREAGPGRKVEITGNNNNSLWTVKIDGKDVTPDPQTDKKPGQVKLHVDDKVTWKITGSTHGIVFPTQKDAEAMFDFDPKQGKALGKSTDVTGFTWGTAKFSAADPLAVATVKKAK